MFVHSEASSRPIARVFPIGRVASTTATIAKLIEFAQNASAMPPRAMPMPANSGPTMREKLNWAEFRAIALPSAFGATSDETSAW